MPVCRCWRPSTSERRFYIWGGPETRSATLPPLQPASESGVLWWALALAACFGGNDPMIGASANVVTVGLAEKAGYHISFMAYIKACMAPMLVTVAIATAYLLLAY
jgi:Na+/H+ antiporter NhaD/arsenite permease-like protein